MPARGTTIRTPASRGGPSGRAGSPASLPIAGGSARRRIGPEVWSLPDLVEGIRRASARTLFFHLVEARLRLGRCTNDLSCWLVDALGAPGLAARLDRLDLLVPSTEALRQQVLDVLETP